MRLEQKQTPMLVRLSDTAMTVANPDDDIRGRKVMDGDGEEIGDVVSLLVDHDEEKVRFMEVGAGGFLGLGETRFLIPTDAITRVDEHAVHVSPSRDQVVGAPRYDPDVVPEPNWDALYGYYGIAPFWTPGTMYPPYPNNP